MRVNTYRLLEEVVERGLRSEVRRVWKHRNDCPPDEVIDQVIERGTEGVMREASEMFFFEQEHNEHE